MTAAGEQVLAYAYTQVGVSESPPNSNNVPYWDPWGGNYGAWCAAFVSYCDTAAGYPLPPIDGAPGFSYCPSGQIAAFQTGHALDASQVEPGDTLIFSWEAWHMEGGIAVCSYGAYAGAPAGDHTGLFSRWLSDSYMVTVEGNTSQGSWDDGGSVLERTDRYTGQICCYARHAALNTGGSSTQPPDDDDEDDDMMRYVVRSEDGTAYACDGIKAYPISSEYTVSVLQQAGCLMTRDQMAAKGYAVDINGASISAAFQIQTVTEAVPDQ